MTISELIADYLAEHARQRSTATVKYYRQGLQWFNRAFGARRWTDLDRRAASEAVANCKRRPNGELLAPDTIRRNLVAIGQLQKWLAEEHDLTPVLRPKDLIKPPSRQRESIPTDEEIEKLFAAAKSPRLRLALESLARSGMRPGELCRARIEDISADHKAIVLHEHKTAKKTGRAKRIPIGEKFRPLIDAAKGDRTAGPLWTDAKGKAWSPDRLSANFTRLRKKLGLPDEYVLYSLRHYCGTQIARAHGIHAAKEILGHTQISTTQRYLHPSDDDRAAWQDAA